jgi:hypothetical protein
MNHVMTLEQWRNSYETHSTGRFHPKGAYVRPDSSDIEHGRTWLWALSDYLVSSVTGGSIWLVPRQEVED